MVADESIPFVYPKSDPYVASIVGASFALIWIGWMELEKSRRIRVRPSQGVTTVTNRLVSSLRDSDLLSEFRRAAVEMHAAVQPLEELYLSSDRRFTDTRERDSRVASAARLNKSLFLTFPTDSCIVQLMPIRSRASSPAPHAASFQEEIVSLIRALGLHRPDQTPCGQPISVAEAQSILELSRQAAISQRGLAAKLQLEKSTVSRLAAILEKRGWLERKKDPMDSRVLRLRLTALGTRVARSLAASRTAKFSTVFAAIPPSKRAAVLESLSILSEALNED